MQPGRPTPSYGHPTTGPLQHFPAPQYPSTSQPPLSQTSNVGQPILPPPTRPPPPGHVPSVPMGSPPQSLYSVSSSNNPPRFYVDSPYSASGPNIQPPTSSTRPPYPGYPGIQSSPPSPPPPPPVYHQGGYVLSQPAMPAPFSSHQGGYGQVPPVASSSRMYVGGSTPPTGVMSGLVEDFSSLSLGSAPGSFDGGLDAKVLPRPLDGDVEPSSFARMYPMNCESRYLRLITSAIPNSQSLVSRWQLPLGAVVCPLAEPPEGEEVPVVNFATTGIVRYRSCRTYVNPYVTFTDGGRKWRCNICALLNDVQNDYFAHLDATGKRVDLDQHPGLTKGSVEFVAPTEYMVRPPMPPLYFFL